MTNSIPPLSPDIWRLDVLSGIPHDSRLDPEWDTTPIWSPDGGRIAFTSWRNGDWDLYQKTASGGGQEELLLKSNEGKFPTHWSWDGRFIAYTNQGARGDSMYGCCRCSVIGSRFRSQNEV